MKESAVGQATMAEMTAAPWAHKKQLPDASSTTLSRPHHPSCKKGILPNQSIVRLHRAHPMTQGNPPQDRPTNTDLRRQKRRTRPQEEYPA
eukprot:21796_6